MGFSWPGPQETANSGSSREIRRLGIRSQENYFSWYTIFRYVFFLFVFNRTHLFITSLMKNNRKQTNNILRRTKDFIAPAVLSALPSHVLTV